MNKAGQRRAALDAREALDSERRREYSKIICGRLLALPELEKARVILSYTACGSEADLSLFNEEIKRRGKILCLPVSRAGGIMEAYCPGKMKKGRFGIWEPDTDFSELIRPEEIDLIAAPCLAFDEKGTRLGHGCGYYDRYLPACHGAEYIAAAFEAQKLEGLEEDDFDFRLSGAVTEKKVYRF